MLLATPLPTILGPLIGALATKLYMDVVGQRYRLADRLGNSVAASSLVGLAAWFCAPAWRAPIFMGSFVAMSAPSVLPSYTDQAGAALATSVLHVLLGGVLAGGFGGRLGLSAMLGVLAFERLRRS